MRPCNRSCTGHNPCPTGYGRAVLHPKHGAELAAWDGISTSQPVCGPHLACLLRLVSRYHLSNLAAVRLTTCLGIRIGCRVPPYFCCRTSLAFLYGRVLCAILTRMQRRCLAELPRHGLGMLEGRCQKKFLLMFYSAPSRAHQEPLCLLILLQLSTRSVPW